MATPAERIGDFWGTRSPDLRGVADRLRGGPKLRAALLGLLREADQPHQTKPRACAHGEPSHLGLSTDVFIPRAAYGRLVMLPPIPFGVSGNDLPLHRVVRDPWTLQFHSFGQRQPVVCPYVECGCNLVIVGATSDLGTGPISVASRPTGGLGCRVEGLGPQPSGAPPRAT
jgi:hypothetical protein